MIPHSVARTPDRIDSRTPAAAPSCLHLAGGLKLKPANVVRRTSCMRRGYEDRARAQRPRLELPMIPRSVARAIDARDSLVWAELEAVCEYLGRGPSIEPGAVNSGTLPGDPAALAHDIDRGLICLVWICP